MKQTTPHNLNLILSAKHHDPFAYLGLHQLNKQFVFRAFLPYAEKVSIKTKTKWVEIDRIHNDGLYEWHGKTAPEIPCLLNVQYPNQQSIEVHDAYSFWPTLSDDELYLFGEGRLNEAYKAFGAHLMTHQGVSGTRFAVWAPNAERVSVIGNFNQWDGRVNPMRVRGGTGVWELYLLRLLVRH